ncbi:MAG: hypothetical protein KC486_24345 [Myxococcales bacterium]|nr:hypothetical protein [Myxococcales bacterium]
MIDKSTLSHYAAARRDALPDIDDAALAGPLEAFFAAGLEDGVASFAAKVEGLPAHLGRLPEPWREAAYAWLWIWVEPSVPAAEARQVLDAAAGLRPLLQRDKDIREAGLILGRMPVSGAAGATSASAEEIARAGRLVDDLAREKAFDDASVRYILECAERLAALPFAAVVPHLSALLEAVRQLWYAQALPEINDALLEVLDQAPSAEALAAVLRDEVTAIDEVVRGYVIEFLEELRRGGRYVAAGSGSTAKQGLRLALAG